MSQAKEDIDLTPIDNSKLSDSPDGQIMDQIVETVISMRSPKFDPHLFLLLHSVFRNASQDPQILDYVAQLPPKELRQYRFTLLVFHHFWARFIERSIGEKVDDLATISPEIDKLVDLFIDHNDATQDSRFKMPHLSHTKKDYWSIIREKITLGRKKRLSK